MSAVADRAGSVRVRAPAGGLGRDPAGRGRHPANAVAFGVTQGGHPQLRLVALTECGTWVAGVKKLTRLPSGSRSSNDRLPHGIVVGSLTKSSTKPARA